EGDALLRRQVDEAEGVAEEAEHETPGQRVGVGASLAPGREVGPLRLGDAPEAADLIAKFQALVNAVVGGALMGCLELGNLGEPVGGQQAAFDGDRVEGELGVAMTE